MSQLCSYFNDNISSFLSSTGLFGGVLDQLLVPLWRIGNELYFEYRKQLAENEASKHRHSMLAIKFFDTHYESEITPKITTYENAFILMLKIDLHKDNKELELHWLDEIDLPEMYLTQYDPSNFANIQSRWKLRSAKALSLSAEICATNTDLKTYTLLLVHAGFELSNETF